MVRDVYLEDYQGAVVRLVYNSSEALWFALWLCLRGLFWYAYSVLSELGALVRPVYLSEALCLAPNICVRRFGSPGISTIMSDALVRLE